MGYLLWLDGETTGLDPEADSLLEVHAALASTLRPFDIRAEFGTPLHFNLPEDFDPAQQLGTVDEEGNVAVVHRIHPVVLEMHTKNGLWDACRESTMSLHVAEARILDLLPNTLGESGLPIHLAGNSVHFDRAFLKKHMPILERRLHHRHFDVSSIKMFCEGLGMRPFPKGEAHRAKADVYESIDHARACAAFCGKVRT